MNLMSIDAHSYALIMAGGAGTRLWPLSRRKTPKQFQQFGSTDTLLQHMVKLTAQVIPMERICIMAVEEFRQDIQQQLPDIPQENLFFEPARRDTGPAVAFAMLQLRARDAQATAITLWSDHLVKNHKNFAAVVTAALEAAKQHPENLVMVGAKPTHPDTGLGYIQMGKELTEIGGVPVFEVKKFEEKPDLETAQRYVSAWEYLWNAGYQAMQVESFIKALYAAQPELVPVFEKLEKAFAAKNQADIASAYEELPKLSLDYFFTQKIPHILVVPSDMGWSDVGNWNALHEVLSTDGKELVTRGPVVTVRTENSLVLARDRLISLVGVKDIVVVDAGDTVLIVDKSAVQHIKELITELESSNPELL